MELKQKKTVFNVIALFITIITKIKLNIILIKKPIIKTKINVIETNISKIKSKSI
jgi:hypothetical protein